MKKWIEPHFGRNWFKFKKRIGEINDCLKNLDCLGLESHRQYLGEEAEQWLGHTDQADVTFICSNSVKLMAHQAVLAPLSPVLKEMFAQQSCGHTRQIVSISMDTDPQVLKLDKREKSGNKVCSRWCRRFSPWCTRGRPTFPPWRSRRSRVLSECWAWLSKVRIWVVLIIF